MSNLTVDLTTLSISSDRDIAMVRAIPATYAKVIRTILEIYMQHGYCHATLEQIARKCGTSKSSAQRAEQYACERGMFFCYRRDPQTYEGNVEVNGVVFGPGRSNILFAAPGLRQAFEDAKKVEFPQFGSKATPIASSPRACISATKQIATAPPVQARERDSEPTPCLPASIKQERKTDKNDPIVIELAAEGVSARQAPDIAKAFSADLIRRTIDLGRHRQAKNPGGYLLTLLRERAADAAPVRGSEHEAARKAQRTPQRPVAPEEGSKTATPATARSVPPLPAPSMPKTAEGRRMAAQILERVRRRPEPGDSRSHQPASTTPRFAG